jgi:hypothetical protein
MEIPTEYIIHDIRFTNDFKGITICGYKRKDVINAFQNSMINNKLEDSIRWYVELHCTGLNKQIWDSIDLVYSKYIHINNPKLFFYILKRRKDYNNIIKKFPKKHEIFSRNNQEIRNLYSELVAILSVTKKNNIFLQKSLPSIKNTSFEKTEIKKRMISKNLDNISNYIHNTTTNEMKLALNEIINNLLYINGTFQNCLFWYLWLEKVSNKNKNKDNKIVYENINLTKDDQYFDHWTFILWNIILSFENKLDKNNIIFIKKMEYIYKSNFKLTSINKYKNYFFICFYIIKHNINWNISLYQYEYLIIQSNANINTMYKNIIINLESKLSNDTKNNLYKTYNQLYFNINNSKTIVKKVKNTNLDEDINKVLLTSYPEYDELRNKKESNIINQKIKNEENKNNLIHKNKTERDVLNQKEEDKNKKISAFTNFTPTKKTSIEKEKNKIKTIIDYYISNDDNIDLNEYKEIISDNKIKQLSNNNNNLKIVKV